MGLKHVAEQSPDRFFVVNDQDAFEIKESLLGRSVKRQYHVV
jgi:hypothetical protein